VVGVIVNQKRLRKKRSKCNFGRRECTCWVWYPNGGDPRLEVILGLVVWNFWLLLGISKFADLGIWKLEF
jgi:hypothetical protein